MKQQLLAKKGDFEMKCLLLSLMILGMAAGAQGTWAASTSAAMAAPSVGAGMNTSQNTTLQKIRKNIRGTYLNWFRGPTVRTLSGNTSGAGANLLMTHYFALSYKLGSRWTIGVTQPFTQSIDNIPAVDKDPFVAGSPYVTLTNARILSSERYGTNLFAYLRYYAPFSRATRQGADRGTPDDGGNGIVRLVVAPTKTFLDGALTVNLQQLYQYNIPKRSSHERAELNGGDPTRMDLIFVFDPIISYAVNAELEFYLEYAMEMDHTTDGHWSGWKKQDYLSPGINYNLTKKLLLNPYLEIEPRMKEVKNTRIGTNIVYYFL